jgi:predicted DNA-binding protein
MSNVEKKAKKKTKMSRINIRISSVLNDWLDEQTRLTGVPKSTICHLAIMNYIQQQRTVGVMADIAKKMEKGEKGVSYDV